MSNGVKINKHNPLLLASSSPRRKSILRQLGIPFVAMRSRFKEPIYKNLSPEEGACKAALNKSKAVHEMRKKQWVLGADTIVVLNDVIFGKPKDKDDCRNALNMLQGKTHHTITGFCILNYKGEIAHLESVVTKVKIKKLRSDEIENYIKTGEPFGKAGSYAIQGIGAFMIEFINGSYTNVVGLPVFEVTNALVTCRAIDSFPFIEGNSLC
jgi:septum formation protein